MTPSAPQPAWSNDREFVEAISQDDDDAIRAFLFRFRKCVGAIAWRHARGNSEDARDLTAIIWLHLLMKLRDWQWREDGSLGGFVSRSARNRAIDWLREMGRTPTGVSTDELAEVGREQPDPVNDPIRLLAIQAVRDCLDQMKDTTHRLAIDLQLLGLEYAEIAEIFGVRTPAVASWISRGKLELKPCLEKTVAVLHARKL